MSEFNTGNDLNDPKQLAAEARELAKAHDQQLISSRGGSALGGHPNPAYLAERTAGVLRLLADRIDKSGESGVKPPEPPHKTLVDVAGNPASGENKTASPDPKSGGVAAQNAGQAETLAAGPGNTQPGTPGVSDAPGGSGSPHKPKSGGR